MREIHQWYRFTPESVSAPVIQRDQNRNGENGPDVIITFTVGNSDSCSGDVNILLYDTGHMTDEPTPRILYDADIATSNDDNMGLLESASMVQFAVEKFYSLGLHEQFALIGE